MSNQIIELNRLLIAWIILSLIFIGIGALVVVGEFLIIRDKYLRRKNEKEKF